MNDTIIQDDRQTIGTHSSKFKCCPEFSKYNIWSEKYQILLKL